MKRVHYIVDFTSNPMLKYLAIASFIAGLEVLNFAIMNRLLGIHYLIATPLSLAVSIVLNWYLSKAFVFSDSKYRSHIEFTLVAFASLVGLGVQLIVITFGIRCLHAPPVISKIFAIAITFFWNFWARKQLIFRSAPQKA